MTETAGLTVFIDGDISGLTEAVDKAQASIDSLSSYTSVGYGWDYTTAKRRFSNWANSGNRSIDEQIKWWQNAMDAFSYDENVQWDAREWIYKLNRKKIGDINKFSAEYINGRDYFGDIPFDSDEAVRVFNEIKELNRDFADRGILTWKEYGDNVSKIGLDMYKGRIDTSEKWLKHEEKYNDLSIESYVGGLERMKAYTDQYFAEGLISYKEYVLGKEYIDDEIAKKYAEEYALWKNDALTWQSDRNLYNDWEENGDNTVSYYTRVNEKIQEFYETGKISWNTMNEEIKEASRSLFKIQSQGDEVYSAWKKASKHWKRMRNTYDDWEQYGDSIVQFYERCIERISQMYNEGHISWQKYMDETAEYELAKFSAQSQELDGIFSAMSSYINELRKQYKQEESSLKESWVINDRTDRISEVDTQLKIYRNAVTERGKDKYRSLLEERKKLSREEQLYNLQKSHNEVISNLEEQYERAESNKERILNGINASNADLSDIAESINVNFADFGTRTETLLNQLILAVNNSARSISAGGNSYTDNRTVHIATGVNTAEVKRIIGNTYVSGLGSVMFNGTRFNL